MAESGSLSLPIRLEGVGVTLEQYASTIDEMDRWLNYATAKLEKIEFKIQELIRKANEARDLPPLAINTPASTAIDEPSEELSNSHQSAVDTGIGTVPEPNEVYIIRDIASRKIITIYHGQLSLGEVSCIQGGGHWTYQETRDGWGYFWNLVSGLYLDAGPSGAILHATTPYGRCSQKMMLRARVSGGYNILLNYKGVFKAVSRMRGFGPDLLLLDDPNSTTVIRWEFIKVKRSFFSESVNKHLAQFGPFPPAALGFFG